MDNSKSAMGKKTEDKSETNPTVAFRIPAWALDHYRLVAEKERRKLGQVLRIILEDHAKQRATGKRRNVAA